MVDNMGANSKKSFNRSGIGAGSNFGQSNMMRSALRNSNPASGQSQYNNNNDGSLMMQ